MSHRASHGNPQKSAKSAVAARDASYPSETYDADQSDLYNALSGAGFGRGGQQIDDTLLDAVTSAAGADLPYGVESGPQSHGKRQQETAEDVVSLLDQPTTGGRSKRKRISDAPDRTSDASRRQHHQFNFRNDPSVTMATSPKRQKTSHQTRRAASHDSGDLPSKHAAAEEDASMLGEASLTHNDSSVFFSEYASPLNMSDARASGVYSAAALFRKPTEASRKYTRPPMSKLFASLELAPENFIRLQSAAKAYMLDPEHEERQNCVGNRAKLTQFDDGKGDTDMTKLRLYHCVEEFLDKDGLGEEYFGKHSEGVARRDWFWPRDGNKVISLVTPLLRRMITNERQRQYALETRKAAPQDGDSGGGPKVARKTDAKRAALSSSSQSHDPTSQLDPQLASVDKVSTRSSTAQRPSTSRGQLARDRLDSLNFLRFAVVRRRAPNAGNMQRFLYDFRTEYQNQSIAELRKEAQSAYERHTGASAVETGENGDLGWVVSVLLGSGKKVIDREAEWAEAVEIAETQMPYINGELTVVVELHV